MKKLRMGVLFALVIAALLLSLNLITSAVDEKERKKEYDKIIEDIFGDE